MRTDVSALAVNDYQGRVPGGYSAGRTAVSPCGLGSAKLPSSGPERSLKATAHPAWSGHAPGAKPCAVTADTR
jgi:hypothetical protein